MHFLLTKTFPQTLAAGICLNVQLCVVLFIRNLAVDRHVSFRLCYKLITPINTFIYWMKCRLDGAAQQTSESLLSYKSLVTSDFSKLWVYENEGNKMTSSDKNVLTSMDGSAYWHLCFDVLQVWGMTMRECWFLGQQTSLGL